MKNKIRLLLRRPGYRYIIIGGSVYLLEILIIVVAQQFGAHDELAVSLSFWIGLMISFILQKLITFGDKRLHRRVLLTQVIAFSCLVLFNFGFTLLLTKSFSPMLPVVLTRTIALGITTIWNFYLYKTRIFKIADKLVY